MSDEVTNISYSPHGSCGSLAVAVVPFPDAVAV